MKKLLFLSFYLLISLSAASQTNYESGYYIGNDEVKHSVLIKNQDWKNNPLEFEFKINSNDEPQKKTVKQVKEFGIGNQIKFISNVTQIDRSSDKAGRLTKDKDPSYATETVFLKVLVDGEADLYYYEDKGISRFFYAKGKEAIVPLDRKFYLRDGIKEIASNDLYKNQLYSNFNCGKSTATAFRKIKYNKSDLSDFFIDYNKCNGSDFTEIQTPETTNRDQFNVSINPRVIFNSFSMENSEGVSVDFGSNNKIGIGVEAEFVLPFKNKKWTVFAEPNINDFSGESTYNQRKTEINYSAINVPLGIRHYFFLSNSYKIFLNGAYTFSFPYKTSEVTFENSGAVIEISSSSNVSLGAGLSFKNRIKVEFRQDFSRDLFNGYGFWSSDFKSTSVIVGYNLF